jgi:hypothetical protein
VFLKTMFKDMDGKKKFVGENIFAIAALPFNLTSTDELLSRLQD